MDVTEPVSRPRPALLGWAGAATYGLVEVGDVVRSGHLAPSVWSIAALVALALLVTGPLGAVPAGLLGLLPHSRKAPAEWPLFVGFATPVAVSLGVWWASDPPPLAAHWPSQGNPIAAAALALVVPTALVVGATLAARRSRPATWVALVTVAGLFAWYRSPAALPAPPAERHPNLLLVTLDTARADRFGAYRIDTQAFDRIGTEGVRFDKAYAQIPVTGPSHTTILSGEPPWEHGVLLNGRPVPADRPLLAEILHGRGYRTAAFVSAYILAGDLGFSRGFDVYDDDFRGVTGVGRTVPGRLFELLVRHRDGDAYLGERRGDLTVDRALDWLRTDPADGRPFFLWVHLFDAHGAYTPPPPYDTRYYEGDDPRDPANRSMARVKDLPPYLAPSVKGITDVDWVIAEYDGEVAFADAQLARLLTALDDRGLSNDTLVVVAGDHGEGLGEEGEWFAHGDHLYEQDLHVPFAMRLPGVIPPGRVVADPVELDDLAPTALDWLGFDAIPTHSGVDLRAAITSASRPRDLARATCLDREANRAAREADPTAHPQLREASVRNATDAVLVREGAPDATRYWSAGVEKPFRPAPDPADPYAAQRQAWRDDLAGAAQRLLLAKPGEQAPIDPATREMLEKLGYIEPAR